MSDLISRQTAIDALRHDRDEVEAYMEECLKQELFSLRAMAKEQVKRIDDDIYILENLPSAQPEITLQPEITFDDVMRYCRPRCLYVIPSETLCGLLGGKPMNNIKALIEELEVQYEAWGKQYSFAMIIRDIEKFATGGDADAEREEG